MSNFLEKKIETDLLPDHRSHGQTVTTRFPPEPNGYLHIGHAKSILLNFGLAKKFDGQCNLRFDDTNPVTEETEYVESIMEDVLNLPFRSSNLNGDSCISSTNYCHTKNKLFNYSESLSQVQWVCQALELPHVVEGGLKPWRDNLFYTSDYFPFLHKYAIELIKAGKAYVDSQSPEDVRLNRGGEDRAGVDSPFRTRSIEENLKLFEEMTDGKHAEGTQLLRAKIEDWEHPETKLKTSAMNHPNMNMRDPPIYRIKFATHHRSGDTWKVYPIYDFAHGQSDAIEHITHSICTLEFENHNQLYR